jgi:hypothetical protein
MRNFSIITLVLLLVLGTVDGVINEGRYRQMAWQNTKYETQKVARGMSNAARTMLR